VTLATRTLRHPGTRPLAWLLIGAMVTLLWGGCPRRAEAQEQEARTAVVLDFGDQTNNALLGRAAAAAMALALTERLTIVRSRAEVIEAVTRLGVRAPYEPDEIRALAGELDAKEVYAGQVLKLEEGDGNPPWSKVLLQVEVYDGTTGDLINGALAEGYEQGTGVGREDRDNLRAQAVERAAASALTAIGNRSLVRGAVLQFNPAGNRVLLNVGSRHGVHKGMLFDIFRPAVRPDAPSETALNKVGRVKVISLSADDAEAEVLSADQGIQSNDILREVFVLPASEVAPDKTRVGTADVKRGGGGGIGNLLAPVLGGIAGVGLLLLLFSMNENTNTDSPRVDAAGGAFLRQSTPGTNPSIVVNWGDRDFSPPPNFIGGYVVYRGQSDSFAAVESEAIGVVPGAAQRNYADDPAWALVQTTVPVRFTIQNGDQVDEVTEELAMEIVHTSPQPGQTYFYKVRRIGPPSVITPPTLIDTSGSGTGGGGGGLGGNLGGGFNRSRAAASRARGRAIAEGRLITGDGPIRILRNPSTRMIRRQVTSIPPDPGYDTTLDPRDDNDLDLDADIGLSNATVAVGPVTYLVPPDLRAPADNNQAQRVDEVNFEWQGVLGATEYVLQMSTNINFSPVVFQSQTIQTTSSSILSFNYNSGQAGFVQLSPNTTYFWRVGTRSTFRSQPVPQPDGYVFSRVFTFSTADQPPAAPRSAEFKRSR